MMPGSYAGKRTLSSAAPPSGETYGERRGNGGGCQGAFEYLFTGKSTLNV
jgi:hypothetical protein